MESAEKRKPLNLSHFPLQFITNGRNGAECIEQAKRVLDGGCLWVQLRMKNGTLATAGNSTTLSDEEFDRQMRDTAEKMKLLTDQYEATLIIDDNVLLTQHVKASGVHLGKNDMPPAEARKILGSDYIIGGTCNTFEDIERIHSTVDYIGCGPFRFTTTKKNLAPTLGLDGYRDITWMCRSNGIDTPIVAIGGITVADIGDVLQAGPNGIALSGEIIHSADMTAKTEEIIEVMKQCYR